MSQVWRGFLALVGTVAALVVPAGPVAAATRTEPTTISMDATFNYSPAQGGTQVIRANGPQPIRVIFDPDSIPGANNEWPVFPSLSRVGGSCFRKTPSSNPPYNFLGWLCQGTGDITISYGAETRIVDESPYPSGQRFPIHAHTEDGTAHAYGAVVVNRVYDLSAYVSYGFVPQGGGPVRVSVQAEHIGPDEPDAMRLEIVGLDLSLAAMPTGCSLDGPDVVCRPEHPFLWGFTFEVPTCSSLRKVTATVRSNNDYDRSNDTYVGTGRDDDPGLNRCGGGSGGSGSGGGSSGGGGQPTGPAASPSPAADPSASATPTSSTTSPAPRLVDVGATSDSSGQGNTLWIAMLAGLGIGALAVGGATVGLWWHRRRVNGAK